MHVYISVWLKLDRIGFLIVGLIHLDYSIDSRITLACIRSIRLYWTFVFWAGSRVFSRGREPEVEASSIATIYLCLLVNTNIAPGTVSQAKLHVFFCLQNLCYTRLTKSCLQLCTSEGRNTPAQPLNVWSIWGDSVEFGDKSVQSVQQRLEAFGTARMLSAPIQHVKSEKVGCRPLEPLDSLIGFVQAVWLFWLAVC